MIIFKNKDVTVYQSMIFKMNSTVITTKDLVLVVDPGYLPQEVEEIRGYVDNIKQERQVYLLFTHSDFDHIVGSGAFPDAVTIASLEFVMSPVKRKQIEDIVVFDDDLYINRPSVIEYPKIDFVIKSDGEQLIKGDTIVTFYQAFGHTNDGLFAFVEPANLLIAGDYLSDIEFPFVYHSFNDYDKTLNTFKRVISEIESILLIPGHGSVSEDLNKVFKRVSDSEDYLQLIKKEADEREFLRFLKQKKYNYLTNLTKRHRENLKLWIKQKN